ncbi:uncharacterized protein LOC129319690 [Prosopis cineraria]|uniref:uncharacterized protein LOC129319690 n=1 Tax=Prosopis cineraria TaxID=364024 RepID=UPI00240EA4F3|nr:uncharacterized protein LOC129319690 [Prosopis cineraria]
MEKPYVTFRLLNQFFPSDGENLKDIISLRVLVTLIDDLPTASMCLSVLGGAEKMAWALNQKQHLKTKELANKTLCGSLLQDDDKKCKVKKKKNSKSASESLSVGVNASAVAETVIYETEEQSKDKKKKKDKSSSDRNDSQFESLPTVTTVKLRDNASTNAKTVIGETGKRFKDKKKRKDKSSSAGNIEGLQTGDHNETDSNKDSFETSNEDVTGKKKKDSKKQRRLTYEEIDVLPADGKMDEEPGRRKIENLNDSKRDQKSTKLNGNLKSD